MDNEGGQVPLRYNTRSGFDTASFHSLPISFCLYTLINSIDIPKVIGSTV